MRDPHITSTDEGVIKVSERTPTVNTQALSPVRIGGLALAIVVAAVLSVAIATGLAGQLGTLDLFVDSPATVGAPSFVDPYREFVQAPGAGAPGFVDPYREFVEGPAQR